jgi:metal-responsive CopG/Arc/MetJ family transcriptional regulator
MKKKIAVTVDKEVYKQIEDMRGIANRSAFTNHILKLGLKAYNLEKSKERVPQCQQKTAA